MRTLDMRLAGWFLGAAILGLAAAPTAAEVRFEERDGVLYVRNVPAPAGIAPRAPEAGARAARYRDLIRQAAERHALSPALLESVIRVESNFQPRAVSPKGAQGLMQLMPATAAQLGVRDVFDVRENIDAGTRHLRDLLDRYRGNVAFALAAYNAGIEAVARYGGIPPFPETQAYVTRIQQLLQQTAAVAGDAGTRVVRRYETHDGDVVYTNAPLDALSSTLRSRVR